MRWKFWQRDHKMVAYVMTFQGQNTGRVEVWRVSTNVRSQSEFEAQEWLEHKYMEPFKLLGWREE